MSRDKNHIPELYSLRDEAFRKAFVVSLEEVEGYWKKHVKKTMEDALKKQPELHYWIGEYYLRRGRDKANDLEKGRRTIHHRHERSAQQRRRLSRCRPA